MLSVRSCTDSCIGEQLHHYNPHFIKKRPAKGYPHVAVHKERQNFPKNSFKNYIEGLKGSSNANRVKELAKQSKIKKQPDVATLEMKLKSTKSRPGTACASDKVKRLENLKYGMNSVNMNGIQQNTTSMFHCQPVQKVKAPKIQEEEKQALKLCRSHCGYMKTELDQRNPYITYKCEKPLCNLSPYLKESRNISDAEEIKIIEMINLFKDLTSNWDNKEDEKLRRCLELQNSGFREKLLACMKEHIQELNLLKSFFNRYKYSHIPQKAQPKSKLEDKASQHPKPKKAKLNKDNYNSQTKIQNNTKEHNQTKIVDNENKGTIQDKKKDFTKAISDHKEVKLNENLTIISNKN